VLPKKKRSPPSSGRGGKQFLCEPRGPPIKETVFNYGTRHKRLRRWKETSVFLFSWLKGIEKKVPRHGDWFVGEVAKTSRKPGRGGRANNSTNPGKKKTEKKKKHGEKSRKLENNIALQNPDGPVGPDVMRERKKKQTCNRCTFKRGSEVAPSGGSHVLGGVISRKSGSLTTVVKTGETGVGSHLGEKTQDVKRIAKR